MDLLDLLLQDEHEAARERLRDALGRDAPALEEVTFNVFEVTLNRESRRAYVFDVLDASAEPTTGTFDELHARLR